MIRRRSACSLIAKCALCLHTMSNFYRITGGMRLGHNADACPGLEIYLGATFMPVAGKCQRSIIDIHGDATANESHPSLAAS